MCQLASLCSNSLEEVVDEGVHDGHGLRGDAGVGVNLLQHLRRKSNSYTAVSSVITKGDGPIFFDSLKNNTYGM